MITFGLHVPYEILSKSPSATVYTPSGLRMYLTRQRFQKKLEVLRKN